jgi:hypothetical protein
MRRCLWEMDYFSAEWEDERLRYVASPRNHPLSSHYPNKYNVLKEPRTFVQELYWQLAKVPLGYFGTLAWISQLCGKKLRPRLPKAAF